MTPDANSPSSIAAGRQLSTSGRIAYFGTFIAILIVAVLRTPIEPWHKGIFVIALAVFGMIRAADGILKGDFRIAEPRILLPMIGMIGLAAVQLIPILPGGHQPSLDPYQTKTFILVFGSLIVCAELLFNYTRNERRLGQLVGLVLIVAIGSSLFGVIRQLLEGVDLDSFTGSLGSEQGYAQFVNRNHFAVLAEMGLGLLIGISLKGELRPRLRLLGWIGCGLLFYSVVAASSRGGLVSLIGMAIFAVFVYVMTRSRYPSVSRTRKSNRPVLSRLPTKIITAAGLSLVIFAITVILAVFLGGEAFVNRIEQIDSEITSVEPTRVNRAAIWESTYEMIKEHPLMGSGFGAYGSAITKYDSTNGRFSLEQAHNDYLEIVANGGVVGAVLFIVFAILVGGRMINNMDSSSGFRRACCFGSIVGVVGVLIHSFVDFGLHVLVNAIVFTALMVIGTARIDEGSENGRVVGT